MAENTRMYWLHALTPLHVGIGFGAGFIDLPIMREKTTGWPVVPGTSVKGVLADFHKAASAEQRKNDPLRRAAFGMADDSDSETTSNSGALVFTDARLVCLPVRSLYGTFAWVTCPLVLTRLRRDLECAGLGKNLQPPAAVPEKHLEHAAGTALKAPNRNEVYFQDLDFTGKESSGAKAWAEYLGAWIFADSNWRKEFAARFAIVPDDTFGYLCATGTEVTARVRINPEQKTVDRGALWYEESLPAESILAGLAWCDRIYGTNGHTPAEILQAFCKDPQRLQIGGKATVGKGRVHCVFGGA